MPLKACCGESNIFSVLGFRSLVSSINQSIKLRNYAKSSEIVLGLFEVAGINYAPVLIFMKIDFGLPPKSREKPNVNINYLELWMESKGQCMARNLELN